MAKRALLHIGMAKTGTTSIQKLLFNSLTEESLPGVDYHIPRQDYLHSQHLLWGLFRDVDELPRWPKFAIEKLGGIDTLRADLESCWSRIENSRKAIISSEYLPVWSDSELADLKERLVKAGFDDVRVLIYVRDPAKFYLSLLQQSLRADSTFISPLVFKTRYSLPIKKFSALFGDITVRSFERVDLRRGCVVQDFAASLEKMLDVQPDYSMIDAPRVNKSLSTEAMIFLQNWNRSRSDCGSVTATSIEVASALNRSRSLIKQTAPKLRPSVSQVIYKNSIEDMAKLNKRGIQFCIPPDIDSHLLELRDKYTDIAHVLSDYNPSALSAIEEYMEEEIKKISS